MPFSGHYMRKGTLEMVHHRHGQYAAMSTPELPTENVKEDLSSKDLAPKIRRAGRAAVWTSPTTGYLNAESYFPSSHPFGRMVNRNASFVPGPARKPSSTQMHLSSVPSGNGRARPQGCFTSHVDSVYCLSQTEGGAQEQRSSSPQNFVERPQSPTTGQILNFSPTTNEVIDHQAKASSQPIAKEVSDSYRSSSPVEESELITQPKNHSLGTTPAFHPLPSMFQNASRPLSFPISKVNKKLPTMALFQNCGLESRTGEFSDSHQELSLALALPGMSATQAPLISVKQAGDILKAVNNPLVALKVGRMTRKLEPNPALLKPTDDIGTLAMWLSPTSDVRLFWHTFLNGPTSDSARKLEDQLSQIRIQGEGSPYKEIFSHVELSEELAWIAAESDVVEGGNGVRLEMMEHDGSGRSFKLTRKKGHDRQKTELASKLAKQEEKTGMVVTDETKKLRQMLATVMSEDPEEEDSFFFWIAESSAAEGKKTLNTMQDRLNHLPTLAEESGVPEKKLQEVYEWFAKGQQAVSNDSTLSDDVASWIGLGSNGSVPSQLFSDICPANIPNWADLEPSNIRQSSQTSHNEPAQQTIREGCALSATANFLVTDKKYGVTHLATASVMVAVGVESTGQFINEHQAHVDLSKCAHELARKRAEAGASAEAERLGRIRLEELVAMRALKEAKQAKKIASESASQEKTETISQPKTEPASQPKTELHNVACSQSEELIQQQRAMQKTLYERNGQRRQPVTTYGSWQSPQVVPGQCIQGNAVLHQTQVHSHSDVSHIPDCFRQHVHYDVPMDHYPAVYQPWSERGFAGGSSQVMVPYQYQNQTWSVPNAYHPQSWPYGEAAQHVYQSAYVPAPAQPSPVSSYFSRRSSPQPSFGATGYKGRGNTQPNMSLVRIAQEAREKARNSGNRVRAGPSGSNLAASHIDLSQDDVAAHAWHESAHQMQMLHRNTLFVGRMSEGESISERQRYAEAPRTMAAVDQDKM